jgi:hypothetical protein
MPANTGILHGLFLHGGATVRSSSDSTKNESGTKWDRLELDFKISALRHSWCGNLALNPVRQPRELGKNGNLRESMGKIPSHISHGITASPAPVFLIWTAEFVWLNSREM